MKLILYIDLVYYNLLNPFINSSILWGIPPDYLHRRSCHTWIRTALIIYFQLGSFLFLLFALLHWLECPEQHWILAVWVDIFFFFLLSIGGNNLAFKCELSAFADRDHLGSAVHIKPQMYIFFHFWWRLLWNAEYHYTKIRVSSWHQSRRWKQDLSRIKDRNSPLTSRD